MDEPLLARCLACNQRLEMPPRTTYAACRKCGSEYLVSRRGGAVTLQPLTPAEVEMTRQVAAVERAGELGCANTGLSIVVGLLVLLCVAGGVLRLVFNNQLACLVTELLALALFVPLAIVMLRNLGRSEARRARLVAAQEAARPAVDVGLSLPHQGVGDVGQPPEEHHTEQQG